MTTKPQRPTPADLQAATGKTVPDLIAPNLRILFCGINPSLYSAVVGHHFARPGNRFWPTLYAAGFTHRLLKPTDEEELLALGYGISNIATRATTAADELDAAELVAGHAQLLAKVQHYQPQTVAILGISAYRTAFARPRATIGRQPETIGGVGLWVLPNPSGLNAHYTPAGLARVYRNFRLALEDDPASSTNLV